MECVRARQVLHGMLMAPPIQVGGGHHAVQKTSDDCMMRPYTLLRFFFDEAQA